MILIKTKGIIILITVCVIVSVLFIFSAGWFLFSRLSGMNNLPEGELITSADSPDGTYRVSGYLCDGGVTVDHAVRAEVMTLSTGKHRNIYWEYHCDNLKKWLDVNTVQINGRQLDVRTESYDYRNRNGCEINE